MFFYVLGQPFLLIIVHGPKETKAPEGEALAATLKPSEMSNYCRGVIHAVLGKESGLLHQTTSKQPFLRVLRDLLENSTQTRPSQGRADSLLRPEIFRETADGVLRSFLGYFQHFQQQSVNIPVIWIGIAGGGIN